MSVFTNIIILLTGVLGIMALPISVNIGDLSSNKMILGGCISTMYGCCSDNVTSCVHQNCSNCPSNKMILGGCISTMYGCCSDNVTSCVHQNCSNCPSNYKTI